MAFVIAPLTAVSRRPDGDGEKTRLGTREQRTLGDPFYWACLPGCVRGLRSI